MAKAKAVVAAIGQQDLSACGSRFCP